MANVLLADRNKNLLVTARTVQITTMKPDGDVFLDWSDAGPDSYVVIPPVLRSRTVLWLEWNVVVVMEQMIYRSPIRQ